MLRQYTWDKAKQKLQHYQRRQPEKSELYRIVSHSRERLPLVWEERFQETYGVLRDEVLDTFDAYLNCGLLCHACLAEVLTKAEGSSSVLRLVPALIPGGILMQEKRRLPFMRCKASCELC